MLKLSGKSESRSFPSIHPKGPLPPDYPLPEPEFFEQTNEVPVFAFTTPQGMTDWYPGPMIGAEAIGRQITATAKYPKEARDLLGLLAPDAYSDYMRLCYEDGLKRFGDDWGYADLVTVVMGLADVIKPRSYLEIGVRRGRSVCAVASRANDCDIAMFDMWIDNYAGMDNPGPDFVREELAKVGYRGKAEFHNGKSAKDAARLFCESS